MKEQSIRELEEQRYLSVKEVSKYTKIGMRKIYSLAKNGDIPSSKVGRKWVFERQAINKWINDRQGIEKGGTKIEGEESEYEVEPMANLENSIKQIRNLANEFEKAVNAGVIGIYSRRRYNTEFQEKMADYLRKVEGEILLCGVSLREYFRGDTLYNDIIWDKLENDSNFKVKALLLDPFSDAGKARIIAEQTKRYVDEEERFKESILYSDVLNTIKTIGRLQEECKKNQCRKFEIRVKFYSCSPMSYLVITPNVLIYEGYHLGREDSSGTNIGCIGELVPLLAVHPKSSFYKIMKNHFFHIFDEQNTYITVKSMEEMQENIRGARAIRDI